MDKALVLGAGSWGTALAMVLARNGHETFLWDIDSAHIEALAVARRNDKYLPGLELPARVRPVREMEAVLPEARALIAVVPCHALPATLARIKKAQGGEAKICLACMGLGPKANRLNTMLVEKAFPGARPAVLSGPSFAGEVAREIPTAVTMASAEPAVTGYFTALFHNERFRIYAHDDPVGVQVGGAIKNVMAIAVGIADGLRFGANTRAALITRGLAEICRLGVAMGGRLETFMGLAGLGDLVLTCTDDQSRNRRLGLLLAEGHDIESARTRIGQAIEGLGTVEAVIELSLEHKVEMPICREIRAVLGGRKKPIEAVQSLLERGPRPEHEAYGRYGAG